MVQCRRTFDTLRQKTSPHPWPRRFDVAMPFRHRDTGCVFCSTWERGIVRAQSNHVALMELGWGRGHEAWRGRAERGDNAADRASQGQRVLDAATRPHLLRYLHSGTAWLEMASAG